MRIKHKIILGSFLVITGLASPIYARTNVSIGIGIPLFYPAPEFVYDRGYYRTYDHHYYHYDGDRDGWHYGRNHREGMREEARRERWEHHHHHHDHDD